MKKNIIEYATVALFETFSFPPFVIIFLPLSAVYNFSHWNSLSDKKK